MKPKVLTTTALCLAALALAALLLVRLCAPRRAAGGAQEPRETIRVAAAKAEEATKTAIAVEARPRVRAAKQMAKAATAKRVEALERGQAALAPPASPEPQPTGRTKDSPLRPRPMPLESLPAVVQAELDATAGLVAELEAQVVLEVARGDAWKEAAATEREAAVVAREEGAKQAKAAWRRGAKWGAAAGAAGVVMVLILL